MNLVIQQTTTLMGQVTPPSSKSQSIRAMFFALLASGNSTIINVLNSDDVKEAKRICSILGADITTEEGKLSVSSAGFPLANTEASLNTGNSGITTRFVLPLLGLRKNHQVPIYLDCGEQMRARPVHSLIMALRQLGLSIDYLHEEGRLPVSIVGQLKGGKEVEVDGITSQYLSALLIALPCAQEDSLLTVKNLHERPYVEMTLDWLKKFNIQVEHSTAANVDRYHIKGGQRYPAFHTHIASDFSSASYLIAAAVLTQGSVEIVGLDMNDTQGDKRIVSILQEMGADIIPTAKGLLIHGGKPLTGISIDANDIPDLLPTLAVLGTKAQGRMQIRNVRQARLKETDRIHSLTEGLSRMGAQVQEYDDGMIVQQSSLQGAVLNGYDDHRTVMALALAGLLAQGQTVIQGSEAINKTFPTFVELMQSLGANMEVEHENVN